MEIRRNICTSNDNFITVSYTQKFFEATDTAVEIYDKYKISILLSDELNAVVKNTIITSGKNSVFFFRPDEPHFAHFTKSGIHSYVDFFIPVNFFESFPFDEKTLNFITDSSEARINYIATGINIKQRISEIAKETISVLQTEELLLDMKLLSLTLQIILLCAENYEKQKEAPLNPELPIMIIKTLNYISENYEQKITLNTLAELCNCSVAYLSRLFKKHIGSTIYNHIIATRIAHAQIMLKNGATVTESCFASGFEDCSNFIQTFKKIVGKTPYVYKNETFK